MHKKDQFVKYTSGKFMFAAHSYLSKPAVILKELPDELKAAGNCSYIESHDQQNLFILLCHIICV